MVGRFLLQNSYFVVDTKLYQLDGDLAFNLSHTINSLSFGKPYPGMHNPLDGVSKTWLEKKESVMYDYYVKVVPTKYEFLDGEALSTNQYSVTESFTPLDGEDPGAGTPGTSLIQSRSY